MSFVVDTDICSAYLRGEPRTYNKFIQHGGGLYVTTITLAELFSWVSRRKASPNRRVALLSMLTTIQVLNFDSLIAEYAGQRRASLLDIGVTVPTSDFFNGAIALYHNFTMVTHNVRDYALIPDLRVQDWLA